MVSRYQNQGWNSKKHIAYVGAKIWNDVPNAIRNRESTHIFKYKMKTHLLGLWIKPMQK